MSNTLNKMEIELKLRAAINCDLQIQVKCSLDGERGAVEHAINRQLQELLKLRKQTAQLYFKLHDISIPDENSPLQLGVRNDFEQKKELVNLFELYNMEIAKLIGL